MKYEHGADSAIRKAAAAGVDVGPTLSRFSNLNWLPQEVRDQCLLVAVTESRTKDEIDRLVAALA